MGKKKRKPPVPVGRDLRAEEKEGDRQTRDGPARPQAPDGVSGYWN